MGLIQQNYFDSGSKKITSPEYRMVAQLGEQLKKEFINHVRDYDSETFK